MIGRAEMVGNAVEKNHPHGSIGDSSKIINAIVILNIDILPNS